MSTPAWPPPQGPTQTPTQPPSYKPSLSTRVRKRIALLVIALLIVAAGTFIRPEYVVFRAGPVYDTLGTIDGKKVIEVKGAKTYETSGELDFTTVAVYGGPGREINLWDYLIARMQPGADIRPTSEVYPRNITRQQIQEETKAQMTDAQAEAKAVAMRAAGLKVTEKIAIAGVTKDGPAYGVLQPGDAFVSMAGKPLTSPAELRAIIKAAKDGEKIPAVVQRSGKDLPVELATTVRDGNRIIGVEGLGIVFDFPVEVAINAGDIGGPSAGLMFSLGLYDQLTPGPLTGGAKIAGTGTISLDGKVGPIGGIRHKMKGARDSQQAQWFLAPVGNCNDVRGNIPDGLDVVKVGTFDEGRRAVEEIAAGRGQSLPRC